MVLRVLALALVICFSLFPLGRSNAQSSGPDAVVKTLYGYYGIGSNSGKTGLTEQNAAVVLTPALLTLYKKAVASGALDADFFVQGQDFSLVKPVEINKVAIVHSTANVSATLSQNDLDRKGNAIVRVDYFIFLLAKDNNGWRIYDAFCHGNSLTDEWEAAVKEGNK